MNINDVESEELPEKLSENLPENAKQRQSRGLSPPGPAKSYAALAPKDFALPDV